MSENIITELLSDNHPPIDTLSDEKALSVMLTSHMESVNSVKPILNEIKIIVDQVYARLKKSKNSRLIYVGAGTSGRIGVQDGAELYPTFGWPKNRAVFLIAGGEQALLKPVEHAEDDKQDALLKVNELKICSGDVILGLAASGNTIFTNEVILQSKLLGALTIGISNNPSGKILKNANLGIYLNTGPEVLAGSTRLKAGTSQKITLNLISTLLMSKLGRIKNGRMTHMIVTNKKLKKRKKDMEKNK